jgi:hypothetical protein
MSCDQIKEALAGCLVFEPTEDGCRISTACLYPSFERVEVYVTRFGEGFIVHDAGGAYRSAWSHGRDEALIRKILSREASRFHLRLENFVLGTEAISAEWLPAAVLSVANASAQSANSIVERVTAAAEAALSDKMFEKLKAVVPEPQIKRAFPVLGKSGKEHRFDIVVQHHGEQLLLLDAVSPHHSSVAHKYVAFSDTKAHYNETVEGFAVYERPLAEDDASLLLQVAQLVPIVALVEGARRAIERHH